MRRIVISAVVVLFIMFVSGYAGGLFTGETRKEESCSLCRALRFTGRHYGFPYERVEDSVLTPWYRDNIDPEHGRDAAHPHEWQQSGCTVNAKAGDSSYDYACTDVPPIFLLRPETELAVLKQIPNKETQADLIRSLTTPDKQVVAQRIKLLIEYYYVQQNQMPWTVWWQKHAAEFGVAAPPVQPVDAQ